jgi:hypothetical protein
MNEAGGPVKDYLHAEFEGLLKNLNILEWIDGHVERASPPATYYIYEKIMELVK